MKNHKGCVFTVKKVAGAEENAACTLNVKHVCALYQLHACGRRETKILGTKQSKGLQGSMEKAVAGRAIQERFESDSTAIRSDSDNLNEKGVWFSRGFLIRGRAIRASPVTPSIILKRGDGMIWGGRARMEACAMPKGDSRILPAPSPELKV